MEQQEKPIHLNENDTPYLYEPFRNKMPENRPRPVKKENTLNAWQGLLAFAFLMFAFNVIVIPFVTVGGMYGNALDEILVFLIGSVLVVRALHIPLKEVFTVKKPDGAGILGTVLMWYVTYRGVLAMFLLMEWIFPQEYASLSESMDSSMAGLSYLGELLVVALTPAICEEALHRGLLQYSLRGIRKKWVILLWMGGYFGAFHMSLIRFLPMMMMGIVLSYVRMKTNNMFYSSLFHFIHNASTIVMSFAASFLYLFSYGTTATGSSYRAEIYIGMYLIEAALMPIGLYLGSRLLTYQQTKSEGFFPKEGRKKTIVKIVIPTVLLILAGLIFLGIGLF